jgi:hypothetical protein
MTGRGRALSRILQLSNSADMRHRPCSLSGVGLAGLLLTFLPEEGVRNAGR